MPDAAIALGSDHAGLDLKREIARQLAARGTTVLDLGTDSGASVDYPDFASAVARAVATGRCPLGILVCGTGIGMSIAANKVRGARAAHCSNELEARLARAHNDANILCLGARTLGPAVALALVDAFSSGSFEGGRHARRVEKIKALEEADT
ncbi:MAG: ribose 5-phosphate isomerase B [Deltaproteobacteria bacterium]